MPRSKVPILLSGTGFTVAHLDRLRGAGFAPQYVGVGTAITQTKCAVGYILGGDERLAASVLETMPQLKAISYVGSGIQLFVDCEYAAARGIALMRTPGPMVDAVAEHTLGLLVGLHRGLFRFNEEVKQGRATPATTLSLCDARVGIIGLGPIGLRMAHLLRSSFDCTIRYWSRARKPEAEVRLDLEYVGLHEIFQQVDCVVILLAANPQTRSIIDQELLGSIREPIIVVNTAAAEVVDPVALRQALDEGRILSAAFDGYWQEPLPPPDHDPWGLLSYPDSKFVITPHVAAKSTRAWPRMLDMAVDNLINYFGGCHAEL